MCIRDSYITKPFSLSVLLLKIEAHFRRRQEKTEAGKMISGDIVFIAGEMKVLMDDDQVAVEIGGIVEALKRQAARK